MFDIDVIRHLCEVQASYYRLRGLWIRWL